MSDQEEKRLQARELLLRARVYRAFALALAVGGLVIFSVLYQKHIGGDIIGALRRPSTVLIVLVPFVPAAVFSWLSIRAENKFLAFFDRDSDGDKKQ